MFCVVVDCCWIFGVFGGYVFCFVLFCFVLIVLIPGEIFTFCTYHTYTDPLGCDQYYHSLQCKSGVCFYVSSQQDRRFYVPA
jgi:hypothetical protein